MWSWSSKRRETPVPVHQPAFPANQAEKEAAVIVITGSSGSGRKKLAYQLSRETDIPYIRPYTTRVIRPNERTGIHYHFVTEEQFDGMQKNGQFFQSVQLERGKYGIASSDLMGAIQAKQAAIVVVNREGSLMFKRHFGDRAVRIFIYSTKEDVIVRMQQELTPYDVIQEYLDHFTEEVHFKRECEHRVQNSDHIATIQKIKEIIGIIKH
ncbi:guanylate kinase [Paenibacillus abyssi]|uniref:Guanylate kinase n=1 Tax=Paenibacillus abyssi TaxID=1340531 RepID=A0A917D8P0_9BACL|nr:guanylate kinase [Paenibacillus abyssi]GGG13241.1 guanylate kinase [Paenibacillus abyssi]